MTTPKPQPEKTFGNQPGITVANIRGSIVEWAQQQEGKPYKWGGVGPNNFDCSGLTMEAYLQGGGITIPRVAAAQQAASKRIPASALQAGDLAFIGSVAHHVGMYDGNGNIIEAPYTGVNVWSKPFDAAGWTNFGTFDDGSGGLTGRVSQSKLDSHNNSGSVASKEEAGAKAAVSSTESLLHAMEAVFHVIEAIATKLSSGAWWKQVLTIAMGLIVSAVAVDLIERSFSND